MKKKTLKSLVIKIPLFLLGLFVALTLFSRSRSGTPLPLRVAWLSALGSKGWTTAFELSVREGWDKQQVIEALGEPNAVIFNGETYEDFSEIDLYESRGKEFWMYRSPFPEASNPAVVLKANRVIHH